LETVLDFAFVHEFLAATSLLEPAEVCRTELKDILEYRVQKVSVHLFTISPSVTGIDVEGLYWYTMQIHNITFALLRIIFI
jgi:hypothetical protein